MLNYTIHLLIFLLINSCYALGLNLAVGYTGLLAVCMSAFAGIGGYATAILTTAYGFNFFLALPIAMALAALTALILGLILTRIRGDYFALATVGFTIIVVSVANNWQSLTNGPFGIAGIPSPSIGAVSFSESVYFMVLCLMFFLAIYALCSYIAQSDFGRTLKAVREDEVALQVFGYKTRRYKLVVFAVTAAISAIGASLFASYVSYIDPVNYRLDDSILGLSFIILGGLASNRGAVLGAAILTLLPEVLRFFGFPEAIAAQMRVLVYGLMLVVLMMYRPQGLVGEYRL